MLKEGQKNGICQFFHSQRKFLPIPQPPSKPYNWSIKLLHLQRRGFQTTASVLGLRASGTAHPVRAVSVTYGPPTFLELTPTNFKALELSPTDVQYQRLRRPAFPVQLPGVRGAQYMCSQREGLCTEGLCTEPSCCGSGCLGFGSQLCLHNS